jgi:hypothetical protein
MSSSTYKYPGEASYSDGVYTRSYMPDTTISDTVYNPGEFFNLFSGRSSVAAKISYAKSGLNIPDSSSDTFTDTYDPSTGSTSSGTEFRFICAYSGYYARDPYNEYSLVADPIGNLYDIYIKNTSDATYIDSATYNGSWSTTTDTAHGRVIIGTLGNTNALVISDNIIESNNNIIPKLNSVYNLGSSLNKWDSIYVKTIYADNYEGMSQSDVAELKYNSATKIAATSDGATITGNALPSGSFSYNLGSSSNVWNTIYAGSGNGSVYFEIGRDSTNGVNEPAIRPSSSGWGYLGTSDYHIYEAYINNIYVGSGGTSLDSYISSHSGSSSIYTTLKGTGSGALFFFKLSIKNNSSSSITVPRGTSLSSSSYFSSSKLSIQSWEERVDDTSASAGTNTFSGTYYTLLRFTVSANTTSNVYVPCVKG